MNKLLSTALVALGLSSAFHAAPAAAQATPLTGTVMWVGFNFCPRGWTPAQGQLLPIAQNTALFSLFGTTYGGDGRTTFGMPDLRGRAAIGEGRGPGLTAYRQGEKTGTETNTMTVATMPSHNHAGNALTTSAGGDSASPSGATYAAGVYYAALAAADATMRNGAARVNSTGGGQSFNNMQPYLVQLPCVALQGTYPSRN